MRQHKRRRAETDHIDPRWEEGRDYQLVCGLDCPLNFNELDGKLNGRKNNCFLPWRWVRDELGVVPTEPGDLAFFLVGADIETDTPGEWVLMEFLNEEWYGNAKTTSGRSSNSPNKSISASRAFQRWRESMTEEELEEHNKMKSQLVKKAMAELPPEKVDKMRESGKRSASIQHAQKWICTKTGVISTPCGLSAFQKAKGIDPSRRVKLASEEVAFIFLWGN